jgi:hypothetical protein
MKYSHSKAMAVFYKIVKLVKNGVLMMIHIYTKVSNQMIVYEENRGYFIQAGGKNFCYIPALNDRKDHIKTLSNIISKHL